MFLKRSPRRCALWSQLPVSQACAVKLLGDFAVEVDGYRIPRESWSHQRGADLVKLLALAPQHRLHREQLMEHLWPDLGPERSAANLRKAVHYARRGLGGKHAIGIQGDMLVLWPGGQLSVDVERFEAEATRALATRSGVDAAAELFTGDLLLEDRFAEWAAPHRERLRARRLELLRAAGSWEQVLELDRTDEEACRALMLVHLERGNRQAAIRQFQRLRDVLRADLGVGPEPATVALFEQAIAAGASRPPSPAEYAQALLARGLVHWNQGDLDAAGRLVEQVRRLSLQHQLGRELGEVSALLGMVAYARGQWLNCFRQEFSQALQLGVDKAPFVLEAHLCLAEASLTSADSRSVGQLAHELLPLAVEAGSLVAEALMSLLIGESELFAGRLGESQEWLSRAAGLYEGIDGNSGHAFAMVRQAELAIARDQPAEATRYLTTARRLAERSELVSHLMVRVLDGLLQVAGGRARQQEVLVEGEQLLRPKEVCRPCSIGFHVSAAIVCARAGQLAKSRQWLAGAERLTGMWQGGPWQAAVWEARSALRLAEGDRAQAVALLREAASRFAECGRPLDEARCATAAAATA